LFQPVKFDSGSIATAASVVLGGGVIVYPTDTVYGLGCDPTNERAVTRLVAIKRREDKPISILCSSASKASGLVWMNDQANALATRFWPGALTIVAPLKRNLPFPLHRGSGTLGVRVPAMPLCIDLIESCGGWLTGTSANISGQPSSRTALEASRQLGDVVDLILDGGRLDGRESTVVRAVEDGIQVLRTGPVRVTDENEDH